MLRFAVLMLSLVLASLAKAHQCHDDFTARAALEIATDYVNAHIGQDLGAGKLAESWRDIPAPDSDIHTKQGENFIVELINRGLDQALYVRVTPDHKVDAVNYTGVFQDSDSKSLAE